MNGYCGLIGCYFVIGSGFIEGYNCVVVVDGFDCIDVCVMNGEGVEYVEVVFFICVVWY